MSSLADVPIGDAYALSRSVERQFVRRARACERAPRRKLRASRMESALASLQMAVTLRVVAKDYEDAEPGLARRRLGDVEDDGAVAARWAEAARRVTLAADRGALAPRNLGTAVDEAAGIEPRGAALHGRGGTGA